MQTSWSSLLQKQLIDSNLVETVALFREKDPNVEDTNDRLLLCLSKDGTNVEKELSLNVVQVQLTDLFTGESTTCLKTSFQDLDTSSNGGTEMDNEQHDLAQEISLFEKPLVVKRSFINLCGNRFILLSRPTHNAIIGTSRHKRLSIIIYRLSFNMIMVCISRRPPTLQKVLLQIERVCRVING
jgi:hypothetical protein